jgi:hypothetical protein
MPSEELPGIVQQLLNVKKQGGAIGVLSVFVATVLLLLRLPPDQINRLKDLWWIILIPSTLFLVSWMFTAYIGEMKSRTQVEKSIQISLATLTTHFQRLFANHLDDKIYLDRRFDDIDDHFRNIYRVLEKNHGYIRGEDTERFMQEKK